MFYNSHHTILQMYGIACYVVLIDGLVLTLSLGVSTNSCIICILQSITVFDTVMVKHHSNLNLNGKDNDNGKGNSNKRVL